MIDDWGITLLAILLLLAISGFFSGSETALTAASQNRLSQWAKDGNLSARLVLKLLNDPQRLIGAILLGNNLANILASSLATGLLLTILGDGAILYATVAMTAAVVIFAEVMPKIYALAHADRMSLKVVWLLRVVVFVLGPITLLVQKIVGMVFSAFGVNVQVQDDDQAREEELRGAIEQHNAPDSHQERLMMRSILDLDDVRVDAVMTHRSSVFMVDANMHFDDNLDKILKAKYSRIPLFKEDDTKIVGLIHVRHLVQELHTTEVSNMCLQQISSEPWFIPETTSLLEQLQAFRERREHFAMVVDEYGDFQGIVTLEDILEEIVGDIDDETDTVIKGVTPQNDGSYLVDGTVTLRDLNRDLDWSLPDDDNAVTVAGLVLYESGRIPDVGQMYMFYGFRFEVMERHRNQIKTLKISPHFTSMK